MFGILDANGLARLSQDLREADWQDRMGDHALAQYLRDEVDELRQLDFAIRAEQARGAGLLQSDKTIEN